MNDELGIDFQSVLAEDLQDEAFREAYERLGPAYEIARLRMERGLTQKQLARLVGTRQSSISRLESWDHEPSLSFLRRVARALGARVEVRLVQVAEDCVPQALIGSEATVGHVARSPMSPQVAEERSGYATGEDNH